MFDPAGPHGLHHMSRVHSVEAEMCVYVYTTTLLFCGKGDF